MRTSPRGNSRKSVTPESAAFEHNQPQRVFSHNDSATDSLTASGSVAQPDPVAKNAQPASSVESVAAAGAFFMPGAGLLTAFGNAASNHLEFSRNAAGNILVNGGDTPVVGGVPTVANIKLIQAFGLAGNDTITLNEANGALPRANLFGGGGNDVLTGGSGADLLFGQADNDTLFGKNGNDVLFGGAGDDVLTGGDGDDQTFGEAGNDRMIWNPDDDNDLMEGGTGNDTAEINGASGAENFTIAANGARVRVDRVDPAPVTVDIGTTENIAVNAGGGDDVISAGNGLSALVKLTIDGGDGNDTINGGDGNDLLLGGEGNDFIDGNRGDDIAFLGNGDDVFQWDPGDGSDVIEGQGGVDTMLFNGSGSNEVFEASANGERLRFTRDVGDIVMDTREVDKIEINALGGVDSIVLNDLTGTDIFQVGIDLAGASGTGDGQIDTVTANATNGDDFIDVLGLGGTTGVIGTAAFVSIVNAETQDQLVINGLGGDDRISASGQTDASMRLTIDGGDGDDMIFSDVGDDLLIGGKGDDFITGGGGDDLALLGAGNDIFVWDAGDGSDTIEGQAGTDVLVFNGNGADEAMELSANSGRLRLTRDVDGVIMDADDVERVVLRASTGSDTITLNDLTGTDVNNVEISLIGQVGQPSDGQLDTVRVDTSAGDETLVVDTQNGLTTVNGGPARVQITGTSAIDDRLQIDAGAGDDVIDASTLDPAELQFAAFGGLGDDVFIGSAGNDLFIGGDGDDVALMGAGDDRFIWNPGEDDDTIEGQAGVDTMDFNGNNASENIDISANGGRVRFFRDVANVTMDTNDVERIEFDALGGADTIVVNDLSGTDVTEVAINLAAAGGAGDAQNDTVAVHGSNGDDAVIVSGEGANLQIGGLAAQVSVTGAEAGNDTVTITGLAGDDVIDASGVAADAASLALDGGDGADVLLGGAGDDRLLGGNGDDVLIGGAGNDVLSGGDGADVLIGGEGDDIFIVGPGDDIIIDDFVAGAGSEDRLDLSGFGDGFDFDWVMAHASMVAGSTVIDFGDQQITLFGVDVASLHQDDFVI
jgi:Ca2+-binding RTX toxin-like protein